MSLMIKVTGRVWFDFRKKNEADAKVRINLVLYNFKFIVILQQLFVKSGCCRFLQ
jgi:hypothetical protein